MRWSGGENGDWQREFDALVVRTATIVRIAIYFGNFQKYQGKTLKRSKIGRGGGSGQPWSFHELDRDIDLSKRVQRSKFVFIHSTRPPGMVLRSIEGESPILDLAVTERRPATPNTHARHERRPRPRSRLPCCCEASVRGGGGIFKRSEKAPLDRV